jgi:hypothetical protein
MTQAVPPRPLVINPDAGRPALLDSRWRRRHPEGDAYDEVVIRGIFDCGPDGGGLELVISPLSFGPTLTCTPESLAEAYTRSEKNDPTERLKERLRDLEARA